MFTKKSRVSVRSSSTPVILQLFRFWSILNLSSWSFCLNIYIHHPQTTYTIMLRIPDYIFLLDLLVDKAYASISYTPHMSFTFSAASWVRGIMRLSTNTLYRYLPPSRYTDCRTVYLLPARLYYFKKTCVPIYLSPSYVDFRISYKVRSFIYWSTTLPPNSL